MSTVDGRVGALLERPSVDALVYALRHPEVWPEGFKWDYGCCDTCAMGLAWKLWEEIDTPCTDDVMFALNCEVGEAYDIFVLLEATYDGEITPEMVADELERLTAPAAP